MDNVQANEATEVAASSAAPTEATASSAGTEQSAVDPTAADDTQLLYDKVNADWKASQAEEGAEAAPKTGEDAEAEGEKPKVDAEGSGTEDPKEEPAAKAEGDDDPVTEEERKRWSQKTRNRFDKLTGSYRDLSSQMKPIEDFRNEAGVQDTAEVARLAKQHHQLETWLEASNVSGDDAIGALQDVADLTSLGVTKEQRSIFVDVAKAITSGDAKTVKQMLEPYVTWYQGELGEELDPAIAQRVAAGEITEDAGREAQVQQRRAAQLERENAALRQQDEDRARQQDTAREEQDLIAHGRTWLEAKARTDGDWAHKAKPIGEFVSEHIKHYGKPTTKEAMERLVSTAYDTVTERLVAAAKAEEQERRNTRLTTSAPGPSNFTPSNLTPYERANEKWKNRPSVTV